MQSSASRSRYAQRRTVSVLYQRIYDVVRLILRGRVMTYGQVAQSVGMPRGARGVGYALRASLLTRPVPWQRVLGRRRVGTAHITIKDPVGAALQRDLLEREGICFAANGGVDLARFGEAGKGVPTVRRRR